MSLPSLDEYAQLRRLLPVVAAALLVVALFLPMWTINVHAVQYPGEVLRIHVYAYPHLAGDFWEMAELNQYIGFYYPDPVYWTPNYEVHEQAIEVPEWSLGPLGFLAVAGAGVFVALAPTVSKLKRGLKWQLVGSITVFLVMVADIQYRLYQAGHTLDPGAPVIGVDEFTPPLWGRYEVANITSYSRFGAGVYLVLVATGLLVVAFYFRDSEAAIADVPDLLRGGVGRVRRRILDRGEGPPSPERARR